MAQSTDAVEAEELATGSHKPYRERRPSTRAKSVRLGCGANASAPVTRSPAGALGQSKGKLAKLALFLILPFFDCFVLCFPFSNFGSNQIQRNSNLSFQKQKK